MTRLDRALAERGLVRSRTEAQAVIAAGQTRADGQTVYKASQSVGDDVVLTVDGERMPFVSRGGLKLAAALETFGVDVLGRVSLDVGASTGGFTDCLLQRGVASVVAIDAGHGQMSPAIAADPRVESREGVNARYLTLGDFAQPFDLIVADLSFISLTLVLPALAGLLAAEGDVIALVKPQFEVGREHLGKGGIVRSASQAEGALQKVIHSAQGSGLAVHGQMPSPLLGGEGNTEFLLWLRTARGTA